MLLKNRFLAAVALASAFALAPQIATAVPELPAGHHDLAPLPSLADVNAIVQSASQGKATAVSVFVGRDSLTGAVIKTGDLPRDRSIVWITPKGESVIANGHVYARDGRDLTLEAMYAQGLRLKPADVLARAAKSGRGFVVGKRGPIITVLFDANCIMCHEFVTRLTPEVDAGHVRVRYVMVGTFSETSIGRAASILAAASPAQALAKNEANFDTTKEEGGYPVDNPLQADAQRAVLANNDLFDLSGTKGTPTLLTCSANSRDVVLTPGTPRDMATFIADVSTGPAAECN